MLWNPFLIKKLLKSVICETVNSTRMHCLPLTKSTIAAEQKKRKKKRKTQFWKRWRRNNCDPNGHIILIARDCLSFIMITWDESVTSLEERQSASANLSCPERNHQLKSLLWEHIKLKWEYVLRHIKLILGEITFLPENSSAGHKLS